MKPPLFSIVLPTRNRSGMLQRAIESVLAQTLESWELYVIDDGSTDDTENLVKDFNDDRIHYTYTDRGERSKARNLGIKISHGDYICFLDDDDWYLDNHLMVFGNWLMQNNYPSVILRTGFLVKDGNLKSEAVNYSEKLHRHPLYFASMHMCGIWSLCIPKGCFREHIFPEQFPYWQDTHLILRLLAIHPMTQLDSRTYVYCIHQGMGSKQLLMGHDWEDRIELNVAAIQHLFENYQSILIPPLPYKTAAFLVSEKYLAYANRLVALGRIRDSWRIFTKSTFKTALLRPLFRYGMTFILSLADRTASSISQLIRKILCSLKLVEPEWRDIEYFDPKWDDRVKTMVRMMPGDCKVVVDLGCGSQTLKNLLPAGCTYIPLDYKRRTPDTLVFDLNQKKFPAISCDLVFISGCMEYLKYPQWLVKKIAESAKYCLISYNTLEVQPNMKERLNNTWKNHLTRNSLISLFKLHDFTQMEESVSDYSIFLFGSSRKSVLTR